jgi:hypothetical protein
MYSESTDRGGGGEYLQNPGSWNLEDMFCPVRPSGTECSRCISRRFDTISFEPDDFFHGFDVSPGIPMSEP